MTFVTLNKIPQLYPVCPKLTIAEPAKVKG
jgi:hypothetical protein